MVKIFVRKNGILYLEYPANGKQRQKSTGLRDTKANRQLLKASVIPKLTAKIVRGELDEKQPELFEIYSDKYLVLKDQCKTAREIGAKVVRIRQYFAGRDVTTIKRIEIREYAAELLRELTPKTVRNYIGTLHGILDIAVQYDVIQNNPAENIDLPQYNREEMEPFAPQEVRRLIENADNWFRNFVAISFYTGVRPGELIGLMHMDIDLQRMTLSISRSVTKGVLSTPKTKSGVREVPIFAPALPYIKAQMEEAKSLYLFAGVNGKHLHGADSMRRRWVELCEKAKVPYRKMYATRHTFITSMLKSGTVSILELAQMVGHANSESIIKNYARFIKGEHLKIKRDFDPFSLQIG